MRILVLYTYLFLSSFFAIGQKENVITKVYLEDAETSKNICDAKVTLEGFEIPEIVGKYDKKGKYYYFTEIPKGYNTVMAYHEKYNEKGFQNLNGLPKELNFKLYDPLNITYGFLKYRDSISNADGKELYNSENQFKDIFVEDLNMIIVRLNLKLIYEDNRDTLIALLENNKINLQLINPYSGKVGKSAYPNCDLTDHIYLWNELEKNDCGNLPHSANKTMADYLREGHLGHNGKLGNEIVFFLEKKSREKFKRFNDMDIARLMEIDGVEVSGLIYNKLLYRGSEPYNKRWFGWMDEEFFKSRKEHNFLFNYTQRFANRLVYAQSNKKEFYTTKANCYDCTDSKYYIPIRFEEKQMGLGILDNKEFEDQKVSNELFIQ